MPAMISPVTPIMQGIIVAQEKLSSLDQSLHALLAEKEELTQSLTLAKTKLLKALYVEVRGEFSAPDEVGVVTASEIHEQRVTRSCAGVKHGRSGAPKYVLEWLAKSQSPASTEAQIIRAVRQRFPNKPDHYIRRQLTTLVNSGTVSLDDNRRYRLPEVGSPIIQLRA